MSALATIARFTSIAVISCLLMTSGMWLYNNRNDISGALKDFRAKGAFHPATWMLWAVSGQDWEELTSPTLPEFTAQKSAFEGIIMNPDWTENYNKSFTWNPDDR